MRLARDGVPGRLSVSANQIVGGSRSLPSAVTNWNELAQHFNMQKETTLERSLA